MKLKEQLRAARESKGFSLSQMARAMGIARPRISGYESGIKGKDNPTAEIIQKWVDATGVTIFFKPKKEEENNMV